MPSRLYVLLASLSVGFLIGAGCATNPSSRRDSARGEAAEDLSAPLDDYSDNAARERVEAHARYANGVLYEAADQLDLAAEEFYKAAIADITNEDLVLEVSRRLTHQRKNERALELLTKATAVPKASGVLFARLGLVYSLLGKKDEAMAANRLAITRSPRVLAGYQYLAQIYLQNGNPVEGLKVLDEAGRQVGVEPIFLIELSDLYLAFARAAGSKIDDIRARAATLLERAQKDQTLGLILQQKVADSYAILGESDRAIEIYAELLKKLPRMPGVREKLTELYLRKQDRKQAATLLEQLIKDNPTSPDAYYLMAGIAFEDKDPKRAANYLQKTVLLRPTFEQAYYDLAGAQISLNEGKEALATLRRAREKFQQNFVGEFFTGLAYGRMKDYSNAVSHFVAAEVIARVTETNRLNHTFYFQLASAYERNKQFGEAEEYFRKVIALSPGFSEAMNYLGYMWAERGENLTEARELIEKAVKMEPENAAYLDSLAWVLFKLEKPKEGLPHLLKAIEKSEQPDSTLFDHLGDIYSKLKEPEKAREAWRKALAVEQNDSIQKKLESAGSTVRDTR